MMSIWRGKSGNGWRLCSRRRYQVPSYFPNGAFHTYLEPTCVFLFGLILGVLDSDGTLGEIFHDGQLLCKFINIIKPDTIKKIETSKLVSGYQSNLMICPDEELRKFL